MAEGSVLGLGGSELIKRGARLVELWLTGAISPQIIIVAFIGGYTLIPRQLRKEHDLSMQRREDVTMQSEYFPHQRTLPPACNLGRRLTIN